jgi:hypothetical protein
MRTQEVYVTESGQFLIMERRGRWLCFHWEGDDWVACTDAEGFDTADDAKRYIRTQWPDIQDVLVTDEEFRREMEKEEQP